MKKLLSILLTGAITLCACLFPLPAAAAGATVSVKASAATVKPGDTVKVTLQYTADGRIGSLDASLSYDAALMDYVSTAGAAGNGNAGVTKLSFFENSTNPAKTHTVTVTFKAKKAGGCTFALTTNALDDWDTYASLGTPSGKTTVNVINPAKSSNANLSALYISSGSLSPQFAPNVTSYQITLPYAVTVLTVSAETADKNATVTVEGSKDMKVGKNTRVVKVTAPDGTVKAYTLNITRQENTGSVTTAPQQQTTPTTTPAAPDAAQVTVGEETKYIAKDLSKVTLPLGYEKTTVTVNDTAFPAVQNNTRALVLLYLTDEKGENGAFYLYNTTDMTFSDFQYLEVKAGIYAFLPPDSANIPTGFAQSFITIGGKTVTALCFDDSALADYYLVYAVSPAGTVGWYRYDSVEGTLQRYTAPTAAPVQAEEPPVENPEDESGFFGKIKAFFTRLWTQWGAVRFVVIFGGGALLLAALVVLIVLLIKRPRDYRH